MDVSRTVLEGDSLSISVTSTNGELSIMNSGVTASKISTSVAGAGLAGGAGTALSVVVDNSTLECPVDTVKVKDGGITGTQIAGSVNLTGTPSVGGYFITTSSTNEATRLKMIRVNITASGTPNTVAATINGGSGLTTAVSGNVYDIILNFSSAFASAPTVIVSNYTTTNSGLTLYQQAISTTSCTLREVASTSIALKGFSIFVIGPA